METLVTADWLNKHRDDPDLVILDCTVTVFPEEGFRTESGRPAYDKGHIPGAGFADLKGALCDRDAEIDYAMPTPEAFCAAMGALGVGDDSRVVLYDAAGSMWAARVWWMLRWVGFDRAALLDGGLGAWLAAGLPLVTEPTERAPRTLTPAPRPALIADRDEVFAAIDDHSVRLVDALPAEMYRGERPGYHGRAGHIPGAYNVSALEVIDETGRFRPDDQLADLFADEDRGLRAITYCGGGIAASSTAFVMKRLGFEDVAVYAHSLQEWAADPANPLVC